MNKTNELNYPCRECPNPCNDGGQYCTESNNYENNEGEWLPPITEVNYQ